ncbi:hypothetical protein HK097_001826, partial [Rhizophlyctis rosea]
MRISLASDDHPLRRASNESLRSTKSVNRKPSTSSLTISPVVTPAIEPLAPPDPWKSIASAAGGLMSPATITDRMNLSNIRPAEMLSSIAHLADAGAHAAAAAAARAAATSGQVLGGLTRSGITELDDSHTPTAISTEDINLPNGFSDAKSPSRRASIASTTEPFEDLDSYPTSPTDSRSSTLVNSFTAEPNAWQSSPERRTSYQQPQLQLPSRTTASSYQNYLPTISTPRHQHAQPYQQTSPPATDDGHDNGEGEDMEELSTDNSITFYQGFRAVYPKMAKRGREQAEKLEQQQQVALR